jgi:hypothetical protein
MRCNAGATVLAQLEELQKMSTYSAMLRAADHIEKHPRLFDFSRTRIPPDCGTPGCALGWIGHFAGRTKARLRVMFGLSYVHRGIAIVTPEAGLEPIIPITARAFYMRMDSLSAGNWRQDALICATAMRLYAERFHGPISLEPAYLAFRSSLNSAADVIDSSM